MPEERESSEMGVLWEASGIKQLSKLYLLYLLADVQSKCNELN